MLQSWHQPPVLRGLRPWKKENVFSAVLKTRKAESCSFKNTQGWKLQFAGLKISDKEPH